jgi:hypothetical protein
VSRCWLCGFLLDSHNTSSLRSDACVRCFPDYDGGVVGVSRTKDVCHDFKKLTTSVHRAKKNIGKKVQVRFY